MRYMIIFFQLLFFFIISAHAADNPEYYQLRKEIIGYPSFPLTENQRDDNLNRDELVHNLRMTHHIPWDITAQKADALAKEWSQQGFNVILAEGTRYLFRDSDDHEVPQVVRSPVFEELIRIVKTMTDACHKYGIRYFQHQTCTMVAEDLLKEHPDWAAIDMTTGKKITNTYGSTNTCISNEDFMDAFCERLERLLKETDVDGLMQDEIQFFGPTMCGCSWCREDFKNDTGYEIPEQPSGWLYKFTDPNYAAWLKWRNEKVVENNIRIDKLLKKYGKENVNITYLANNSSGYPYYGCGLLINQFKYYADSIGYECEPPDHRYQYYWPLMIWEMKYLRSMAELMDTGMWTLFYNRDLSEYTWNWMVSMTQGSRLWWLSRDKDAEPAWQPVLNWEIKHANILEKVRSAANIGLFYSLDSLNRNPYNRKPGWIHGFASTCYALSDHHIPYRIIIDEEMDYDQLKEKINTLVIFNTMSMSDKAAAEIKKFVENGGTIVASGEVSLYDESGHKRENFALSDVLGFSHVKEHKGPVFLTVANENPVTGDITGRFIEDDFYVQVKDLQDSTNVYGYILTSDQQKYPGIITNDYGKGKVVYFASHPEKKYNFHYYNDPKIVSGKYWIDPRDKTYGEIIKRAVTCYNTQQPLVVENLPKGVIAEVYSHENEKMKGFQVHIANFLGGYVQEGIIPMYHPISFPEVKNNLPRKELPISIKVKAENVKDVFLLSPDFDATVKLDYQQSQGYVHVSLPTVYRYFILYFSQGDSEPFLELNPDNVTDQLPPAKELIIKTEKPLAGDYDPGFTTVFANEENFQGGYRIGVYKGEIGGYLYGQDGQYYEATALMNLQSIPANPVLEIGGMDDNAQTKAQMEIRINGQLVYTGPAEYPDRSWGLNEYAVDPEFLKKGKNVIEFKNLGKGVVGSLPWYGINFVRIKESKKGQN